MPRRKKRKSGRGRPSALSQLTVAALLAEIDRRRGKLGDLQARRSALESELEALHSEIADIESSAPISVGPSQPTASSKGMGRGPRKSNNSLSVVLHSLLNGRTLTIEQMADAAKKSGYKSKSKSFRTVVSLALLKNRKMFKRVSRGQYTAK